MTYVALAEVSRLLEVGPRQALRLAARPDFPAPVARLTLGRVWDAEQVLAWARTARR